MNCFELAKSDREKLAQVLYKFSDNPNERDDGGLTLLHFAAWKGWSDIVKQLLTMPGLNVNMQEYVSGWTPLHYAIYNGHIEISLQLLKAGAILNYEYDANLWISEVISRRDKFRAVGDTKNWRPISDHEGHSPMDLLSSLHEERRDSSSHTTSVYVYGKADFQLGIQLPNVETEIYRPRRIDCLENQNVVSVVACKYHSVALTQEGRLFSWGIGRGGRLGHGNEEIQPFPCLIRSLSNVVITAISAAENHCLAVSNTGEMYSWGSNRHGQLGHGENLSACDGLVETDTDTSSRSARKASKDSSSSNLCTVPRKINALQRVFVLGAAAGESHSLCFTDDGEVVPFREICFC